MSRLHLVLASLLVACGSDQGPDDLSAPTPLPVIEHAAVQDNPDNVLSAVVVVRALHTDSAEVRFRALSMGQSTDSVTARVAIREGEARVPVLGLFPGASYSARVAAFGIGGESLGEELTFSTGPLPTDLPSYAASGSAPSSGYVAFAAARYGLVIDNSGRIVWYRRFDPGVGLNFQAQPNGRYVALPPSPDTSAVPAFIEVDPLGEETRRLGCAGGLRARFHDLLVEPDGDYWIMCDETRTMDLTALGGLAQARVTGTVVQHIAADGALLFQWSAFDHFSITDLDSASYSGANVNWTHGNALALDGQTLLVSFRSLNEITAIDRSTGAVRWRMGGRRNQFTFQDTPTPGFARQHGVRVTTDGLLQLLDNMGDPQASRAERYQVDAAAMTVRLVAAHAADPAAVALLGGTTQELADGRLLVAYGNGNRVEEYDEAGQVVWRIEGNPGYVFRAQRIRSLYAPGVGIQR